MELKQADIFGGCRLIVKKNNKKKYPPKNSELEKKIELLYKLYEKLYNYFNISILEQRDLITIKIKNTIINIYPEEKQAEPTDICSYGIMDSIDKRIFRMNEILCTIKQKRNSY